MFKKTLFVGAGALLVLGLLFGRNLVPYAGTAVSKARNWAEGQVDTSYKIETARRQLEKVREQIKPMTYTVAKQEVEVNRLAAQIEKHQDALANSHVNIMKLRDHLASGDSAYVSHGRTFANQRVKEDLSNRFRQYKASEVRLESLQATLEARRTGLEAAIDNLRETEAQRRSLEVEINSLEAQSQMLEVAKTASQFTEIDNSELARTREMIDQIRGELEAEAIMIEMAPEYLSEIPMDEATSEEETDIIQAIDQHFGNKIDADADDTVVSK